MAEFAKGRRGKDEMRRKEIERLASKDEKNKYICKSRGLFSKRKPKRSTTLQKAPGTFLVSERLIEG